MSKFIVWDGYDYLVEEFNSLQEAESFAHQSWLDNVDQDYWAKPYTKKLAEEYGLEEDEDE